MSVLIFDSGVGGLSVLGPIRARLPGLDVIYAADNAGFPYGTKSEAEIAARVPALLGRLVERYRPALAVIACNTASTIALAPDVPELPKGQLKGTLRQQMEQHRADPSCASCHAKLDPLGFGLENFDAIGGWRDQDNKIKIDATGVLPDGAKFDGPSELRKVLLGKSELFRRCLAEKLLTFATGRGLEYYDKCVLDELSLKLKAGGDKFSALVLAIAESDAFQKRKATRSE